MDFFSVILFLGIYYIRPHEWNGLARALHPVLVSMVVAILALIWRRVSWRDFLKTPHDWMMLAYFVWFYIFSPTFSRTWSMSWKDNPMPVYYLVAVVTLSSLTRLQSFLNWWTVLILALAGLAVASEYGFDPTHSYDVTLSVGKGRLTMSTSIFRNPNALGHSVVPVIVMLYFIGIWKRPLFVKIAMMFVMALPLYCVFLTASKGAFLTCFATIFIAITFRRPKVVQIIILFLALTAGWTAVQLLPRMEEVSDAKNDQAIQGRVAAFRFGLDTMKSKIRGVGYPNFQIEFWRRNHYVKAPHSSYVRVGAEQGMIGLFLFLGTLYCCARTLIVANTTTDAEERIRRTLFVMLASYAASSWMIGWSDRCTFFLMVAAVSAFHRQLFEREQPSSRPEVEPVQPRVTFTNPAVPQLPQLQLTALSAGTPLAPATTGVPTTEIIVEPGFSGSPKSATLALWNRIGLIDLALITVLTYLTIRFWEYAMNKM